MYPITISFCQINIYAFVIVFPELNSASGYLYNKIGNRKISVSQNCTNIRLFLSSNGVYMVVYLNINSKYLSVQGNANTS